MSFSSKKPVALLAIATVVAAAPLRTALSDDLTSDVPLSAICTDRPTKSNYACTVEQGHFQYETDVVNSTVTHSDGVTTDTWLVSNPTFKYGISATADFEVNIAPFVIAHTREQDGARSIEGVGDLYLRVKYRFLGANDSVLSASAIPYVKLPTASGGIGNGSVEEGVIVPFNYKLSDALTLTVVPELDRLLDSSGQGHHVNFADAVNLAYAVNKKVVLYGEVWMDLNSEPRATTHQYTADVAVTYGLTDLLQVDAGFNVGLNSAAPALQGYLGLSQKF